MHFTSLYANGAQLTLQSKGNKRHGAGTNMDTQTRGAEWKAQTRWAPCEASLLFSHLGLGMKMQNKQPRPGLDPHLVPLVPRVLQASCEPWSAGVKGAQWERPAGQPRPCLGAPPLTQERAAPFPCPAQVCCWDSGPCGRSPSFGKTEQLPSVERPRRLMLLRGRRAVSGPGLRTAVLGSLGESPQVQAPAAREPQGALEPQRPTCRTPRASSRSLGRWQALTGPSAQHFLPPQSISGDVWIQHSL